jgi:hypothetical protein
MTSLYTRMRTHGTLTETPDEIPDAVFELPSTLNWMRAEAILVSDCALDFSTAQAFYGRVQRKELSERQLNSVFEQLLFSLHQIAALRGMAAVPNKADVARVGIVTWYYGTVLHRSVNEWNAPFPKGIVNKRLRTQGAQVRSFC